MLFNPIQFSLRFNRSTIFRFLRFFLVLPRKVQFQQPFRLENFRDVWRNCLGTTTEQRGERERFVCRVHVSRFTTERCRRLTITFCDWNVGNYTFRSTVNLGRHLLYGSFRFYGPIVKRVLRLSLYSRRFVFARLKGAFSVGKGGFNCFMSRYDGSEYRLSFRIDNSH